MIFKEETAEELRKKTREEIIADIRRDTLILDLMFLEVKRDIEELLAKHKSNPNVHLQPRHPSGTREGGQWMREGDSSMPSVSRDRDGSFEVVFNDRSNVGSDASNGGIIVDNLKRPATNLSRVTVLGPDRKPVDRVNIFVGGAQDSVFRNVIDSDSKNKYVYGDNYYAGFDDEDKINALVESLPKDQKINLIGHSLGGHTVTEIALANPGKINVLVTVDPVTRPGPANPRARPKPLPSSDYFKKVRNSVGTWINVNAEARGSTIGNISAGIGGPWNNRPKDFAHLFVLAPHDHEYFDNMMDSTSHDGRTAIEILNNQSKEWR